MYAVVEACRYVRVCSSLYYKFLFFCCCLTNRLYTNIYILTNLLPLASAHAVLAEEDHSNNSRALGVPVHCAACYSSSPRLRYITVSTYVTHPPAHSLAHSAPTAPNVCVYGYVYTWIHHLWRHSAHLPNELTSCSISLAGLQARVTYRASLRHNVVLFENWVFIDNW